MEGFEAFAAGIADTAGRASAFITSVGMLVRYVEFEAERNDFGFPFVDKWGVDTHVRFAGGSKREGIFEGIVEVASAIAVGGKIVFDG